MTAHYITVTHAAFTAAQTKPDEVDISSFTRAIYALLSPSRTFWRAVGITPAALAVLGNNLDIRRQSCPSGIQRAHIQQRSQTVAALLKGPPLTPEQLEQAILGEADHTVICAKGENNNKLPTRTDIIWFDNEGDDPLFQSKGFSARWSDPERALVRKLSLRHEQ